MSKNYNKWIAVLVLLGSLSLISACGGSGGGGGTSQLPPVPVPAAPTSLMATAVSSTIVNLTWTDNSSDEDGFKIERSTDGATFALIVTTLVNTTALADIGRVAGTKYYYRVRAYNTGGNSTYSNIHNASTPAINIPKTGQVVSYGTGTIDDGALQKGIDWPNPRFTVASSGTGTVVTDGLTGLMWAGDGGTPTFTGGTSTCTGGPLTWQFALDYVVCLNTNTYLGYSDWRMPNINELESLINYGSSNINTWLNSQGFNSISAAEYWTSTIWTYDTGFAWYVHMQVGYVAAQGLGTGSPVLPVRGSVGTSSPAGVPKTGQIISYGTGSVDDGALQKGVAWPSPRFTAVSSGTGTVVTDGLTGLMWAGDGGTPLFSGGTSTCTGGTMNWQSALDYVACLNTNTYLGYTDWRLPNSKELRSHTNYGPADSAAWKNDVAQGFSNVNVGGYWSSSSFAADSSFGWAIHMNVGNVYAFTKANTYYAWPVRGGFAIP